MTELYEVEIEPEVRSWLAALPDRDFGRVDFLVGLLAEHAEDLGEPYTRHLGGKVRELRFHLLRQQTRVTYWLAPGRRGDLTDRVPQDPQHRNWGSRPRIAGPTALRERARHRA
jgi:Phage derived protein Gp49-like (DUF891)